MAFQKYGPFEYMLTTFFSRCSLYRGKVGLDAAEAKHLMDGLDWPGAVKDISASVNWLKSNGSKKVPQVYFSIHKLYQRIIKILKCGDRLV